MAQPISLGTPGGNTKAVTLILLRNRAPQISPGPRVFRGDKGETSGVWKMMVSEEGAV